jgi:hypothetical protein
MFSALIDYIGAGITDVFSLFGEVLGGGIALFWDESLGSLTNLGEVMLLSSIVGLVLFGIQFIRNTIPFIK